MVESRPSGVLSVHRQLSSPFPTFPVQMDGFLHIFSKKERTWLREDSSWAVSGVRCGLCSLLNDCFNGNLSVRGASGVQKHSVSPRLSTFQKIRE